MSDDEMMSKPTRKELVDMLDATINNIENLPEGAMYSPITHADFWAALILIKQILIADQKE